MAEINYIRYETNTKGKSYSSVAKQMNRDRRTIKKYAEQDEVQIQQPFKQKRKARVMDPVKPIIDQWIREDRKKKISGAWHPHNSLQFIKMHGGVDERIPGAWHSHNSVEKVEIKTLWTIL